MNNERYFDNPIMGTATLTTKWLVEGIRYSILGEVTLSDGEILYIAVDSSKHSNYYMKSRFTICEDNENE
jgi:hypothetical protein